MTPRSTLATQPCAPLPANWATPNESGARAEALPPAPNGYANAVSAAQRCAKKSNNPLVKENTDTECPLLPIISYQ
jgi:hypothetical protein